MKKIWTKISAGGRRAIFVVKDVSWPGWHQILTGSFIVVVLSVIIGGYLLLADLIFNTLRSLLFENL